MGGERGIGIAGGTRGRGTKRGRGIYGVGISSASLGEEATHKKDIYITYIYIYFFFARLRISERASRGLIFFFSIISFASAIFSS